MKTLNIFTGSALLTLFTSCTNTAFVGHDRAYDLNVGLAADLTKVASVNAGFEGKSFAAVPPEQSLIPVDLLKSNRVAKGEALSTLSALKIQRLFLEGSTGAASLDFIASTATGDAADKVAEGVKKSGTRAEKPKDGTLADAAAKITNETTSIPSSDTAAQDPAVTPAANGR